MATLLQHPLHGGHPLKSHDFREDSITAFCKLCCRKISADGYACKQCEFYAHRACAEAPPRIDLHPLHTDHPLTLIHPPRPFRCDYCGGYFSSNFTLYGCRDCNFVLDFRCALFTLSDRGGTQGKTPEKIKLPLHHHRLTSFSTRHGFIGNINCVICKASADEDWYACSGGWCEFLIHRRCIQDLYYKDGTKVPRIYHGHPLKTFQGEDMGSIRCAICGSEESREFIGCAKCQVFYCRDCVQVPESIQYPHHPDHTLVLLISSLDKDGPECDSCLVSLEAKLCYGCPFCEFFVDLRCGLQVLAYCGEGMTTEIDLSWHKHQLQLCHRSESHGRHCSYCEDTFTGPLYACKAEGCEIVLHKRCTEIEVPAILQHPHHPEHPLTFCHKNDIQSCEACCEFILRLYFSCELCEFYLHAKCAAHLPTLKNPLHEHKLLHLEEAPLWKCNRCGTTTLSPFFRCVLCDLNLHEECMELPLQVVNSKVHWHPLTLHETYIEDDSGEYYCDHCEKSRDVLLGAYVCLQCSARWAYHIECVFPEFQKVYEKKSQTSIIRRFNERIARKNEEFREAEVKLEGIKRELDQLIKKRDELISGEEHYETATDQMTNLLL